MGPASSKTSFLWVKLTNSVSQESNGGVGIVVGLGMVEKVHDGQPKGPAEIV